MPKGWKLAEEPCLDVRVLFEGKWLAWIAWWWWHSVRECVPQQSSEQGAGVGPGGSWSSATDSSSSQTSLSGLNSERCANWPDAKA